MIYKNISNDDDDNCYHKTKNKIKIITGRL